MTGLAPDYSPRFPYASRRTRQVTSIRIAAGCFACLCLLAQQSDPPAKFEVASFQRWAELPRRGHTNEITPTSITMHNASLGNCISWAFGYQNWEVVGPAWRDYPTDVVYEIVAKTAAPASESELKRMFQELVKERLRLAYHLESRDLPIYALVVDRGGPKLRRSTSEGPPKMKWEDGPVILFERMSMADFAHTMDPPFTSRHTVDETGLLGTYDFTLDLAPYVLDAETGKPILDYRGAIDEEGAHIKALPKQLGLRLERRIAPVATMIIDHVEKDPTAN
jgi:uncharacterized protein (TIGR03435 family)